MKPIIVCLLALLPDMVTGQIGSKVKSADSHYIEGIWQNNEFGFAMVLILNAGGTGEFDGESIQYSVLENMLSILSSGVKTNYQYSVAGNHLTLSGGDLDKPVIFSKDNTNSGTNTGNTSNNSSNSVQNQNNSLIGKWDSDTESLEFKTDGNVIVQGVSMSYSISGNNLTVQSQNGSQNFTYTINGDYLTINVNGQNQMYRKSTAQNGQTSMPYAQRTDAQADQQNNQGNIAPELVGKWCYINTASAGSGGWSTDECIVINGDGTYEYNYESSGSASGTNQYGDQTFAGGTASQSSDRGTWRLSGNTLFIQSQARGALTFTLQKENHPKNGDPMIVIDGRTYVTFYQKPGW